MAKKGAFCKGEEFVQLLECNENILSKLLAAYLNALIRYDEKMMKSNEISNEMLALLSGEMNIGKAIKKVGIKTPNRFIVFCTSSKNRAQIRAALKLGRMERVKLRLDIENASDVAATPLLED